MSNINRWVNLETWERVVSKQRLSGNWKPTVSFKRIHGSNYTPYSRGSAAWNIAANYILAKTAQARFERKS